MAIGTDDAIHKFGTQDQVISVAGTNVANGAFSDSGDFTQWTNDDDAPIAIFVCDFTMGANPDAGSTVDLYARLMNISDTTQDANEPSTDFFSYYLGSFQMDDGDTAQLGVLGPVGLPNTRTSQVYDFYVQNNSGQTLNTGSTVDIVPLTYGPHA